MSNKVLGSGVKNMYSLSIIAIIAIIILNLVSWKPITNKSTELQEEWQDHKSGGYCDKYGCSTCERFEENIAEYNQQGAILWQNTITNCVMIALGGAIVYGVGIIIELKQEQKTETY